MNLATCIRVLLILRSNLWSLCPPERVEPQDLCLCHPRGWQKCLADSQKEHCAQVSFYDYFYFFRAQKQAGCLDSKKLLDSLRNFFGLEKNKGFHALVRPRVWAPVPEQRSLDDRDSGN